MVADMQMPSGLLHATLQFGWHAHGNPSASDASCLGAQVAPPATATTDGQ